MWLSYIIPLYNCGEYIAQCLDSILVQGLDEGDYEVIVVNDGSTDNGPAVVEEYCRKYQQIKLLTQANSGAGSARNSGIDVAIGYYIYFVDADDWLAEGGMKVLRENYVCDKVPDIIMFNYKCVCTYCNSEHDALANNITSELSTSQEYLNHNAYPTTCWKSIISRNVIVKNNLRFTKHVLCEDGLFMLRLFTIRNLLILNTNLNVYRYRIRSGGLSHPDSNDKIMSLIEDALDAVRIEDEYIRENSLPEFQKHCASSAQWQIIVKLLTSTLSYNEINRFLCMAIKENIYPIENPKSEYQRLINRLYKYPILVYLLSKPVHILYPFHKRYYNYVESRI
jgi:glycosyltransferase involved in cell wall biosynthesis